MNKSKYKKLTPEQEKQVISAISRTWNAIAYDALQCVDGRMSQRDAIEVTLDANRVNDYGDCKDEELLKWINDIDNDKACMKLAKLAIPGKWQVY
jgi:hypothetical protein